MRETVRRLDDHDLLDPMRGFLADMTTEPFKFVETFLNEGDEPQYASLVVLLGNRREED